jgi:hypothetical protein
VFTLLVVPSIYMLVARTREAGIATVAAVYDHTYSTEAKALNAG